MYFTVFVHSFRFVCSLYKNMYKACYICENREYVPSAWQEMMVVDMARRAIKHRTAVLSLVRVMLVILFFVPLVSFCSDDVTGTGRASVYIDRDRRMD